MDILNIKKKKNEHKRLRMCNSDRVRKVGKEPEEMNPCSFLHLFICLSFFFSTELTHWT